MTKAQAATVSAALVNAGYLPQVAQQDANTYTINVSTTGAPVVATTLTTFASSNGVTAQVRNAEFI